MASCGKFRIFVFLVPWLELSPNDILTLYFIVWEKKMVWSVCDLGFDSANVVNNVSFELEDFEIRKQGMNGSASMTKKMWIKYETLLILEITENIQPWFWLTTSKHEKKIWKQTWIKDLNWEFGWCYYSGIYFTLNQLGVRNSSRITFRERNCLWDQIWTRI